MELVGDKTKPFSFPPEFCEARQRFIQRSGFSSPDLDWDSFADTEVSNKDAHIKREILDYLDAGDVLLVPTQ